MAEEIPADWYPDATGTVRWWDGQQWTEHVRDERPSPAGVTAEIPAYMRKPSGEVASSTYGDDDGGDDGGSRRVWLTSTFVGLLAFFLGMGIGGRGEPATPTVPTPAVPTAVGTPTPDPELERLRQELDQRAQELDDREEELDEREWATPTPTPTIDEDADETIDDGTWEVGIDVPAGTYTTTGPRDDLNECSYRVSTDDLGEDILDDDSSYESMTVALSDGQFFTSENCETWERI